ncbi:MAG: hypothetical protein ABIP49_10250 [Lysobacterales bacterium]
MTKVRLPPLHRSVCALADGSKKALAAPVDATAPMPLLGPFAHPAALAPRELPGAAVVQLNPAALPRAPTLSLPRY